MIKIWEIIDTIMRFILIFLFGSYLVSRYFDKKQWRETEDLRKQLIKVAWQERKQLRRLKKLNDELENKINSFTCKN